MEKLKHAIYGFAVADALGVPYEFKTRGSFQALDMIGYGTYNKPEGTWSDDTSMTIATCYSIREKGNLDFYDIMDKFCAWAFSGKYTPFGENFDIGNSTFYALNIYKKTKSLEKASQIDERSNGNGSLMRMIPLIFINSSNDDIEKVSALTHGHKISKEACRIYVEIGKRLLNEEKLEDILENIQLSEDYSRLKYLEKLDEDDIQSNGYVLTSLEAALWCLIKTDNYKDCVLKAVNLGSDTDTIAAIAGGLAGIIYGLESIPKDWIEKLKNKELIDSCLF